jgi:hypothetical protein
VTNAGKRQICGFRIGSQSLGSSFNVMPAGFYPIIYVRGFAATAAERDEAADDPFCGLNIGSTVQRPDEKARFAVPVAFEGPLVRLMQDYGYVDTIEAGLHNQTPREASAARGFELNRTIWIFRYYDNQSRRFEDRKSTRDEMLEMASDLYKFIGEVRAITGEKRVHLVAHSMGGLICRCLIQRIYAERTAEAPRRTVREIARFFTYATPHNGIESGRAILGAVGRALLTIGILGTDVFHHDTMFDYLTPGVRQKDIKRSEFKANQLTGFPLSDIFCLIGTNYKDYRVLGGASQWSVGPGSDGLVLERNAFVEGAARECVHRSHSGPFGILNSEQGYYHLVNFLFGGVLVVGVGPDRSLPAGEGDLQRGLVIEAKLSRPGAAEFTCERTREHLSATSLAPGFMSGDARIVLTLPTEGTDPGAYRIVLAFYVPREREEDLPAYLTPDCTAVAELHVDRKVPKLRWVGSEAQPAEYLVLTQLAPWFERPLRLQVRWREEPEHIRMQAPPKTAGGGTVDLGETEEKPDLVAQLLKRQEEARRRAQTERGFERGMNA